MTKLQSSSWSILVYDMGHPLSQVGILVLDHPGHLVLVVDHVQGVHELLLVLGCGTLDTGIKTHWGREGLTLLKIWNMC